MGNQLRTKGKHFLVRKIRRIWDGRRI